MAAARVPRLRHPANDRMIDEQIVSPHPERPAVTNQRVIDALRQTDRRQFVPAILSARAYEDRALPIGNGQTISQPYIVARALELLDPPASGRALEVGLGSGYQAAVLANLVREVVAVERIEELYVAAERRLRALRYTSVTCVHGDGSTGKLPSKGANAIERFEGILIAATAPEPPRPLLERLAIGGRMVVPVAELTGADARLTVITRTGEDAYESRQDIACRYVRLLGVHGYQALPAS